MHQTSIHHLVNLKIRWAKTDSGKSFRFVIFIKSMFVTFESFTTTYMCCMSSFALVRISFYNMNWGNVTIIFHIEFHFLLFPYWTIILCRSFSLMSPLICFDNSTYSVFPIKFICFVLVYMYHLLHSLILFSFLFGGDVQNM